MLSAILGDARPLAPLRLFVQKRAGVLLMALVATIVFGLFLNSRNAQSVSVPKPYDRRDLERMCASMGGGRIGAGDFEQYYQPGGRDTWVEEDEDDHWEGDDELPVWDYESSGKMTDPSTLLKGPPTASFKDNLRPELKYITGWYEGGLTNQFMGATHILFTSLLTPSHIPVLPPFIARPHLPVRAGYKRISEIYDLERWARSIHKHVVEWADLKDLRGEKGGKAIDGSTGADTQDEIGCWSVWATAQLGEGKYHTGSILPSHLNLDVSYTPVPREARLFPYHNDGDHHVTFNSLATLASHSTPTRPNPLSDSPLPPTFPNPGHEAVLAPDRQLVCFDFLYYLSTSRQHEWEQSYSPAWNLVGRHARWSDAVRRYARTSLALTLGAKKRDVMLPVRGDVDWREDRDGRKWHPNDLQALAERDRVFVRYLAVHARHGDFLDGCARRGAQGSACHPSLEDFAAQVEEVERELRTRGVVQWDEGRLPVIMTSDETSEEWWAQVDARGWKRVVFPEDLSIPDGVVIRDAKFEDDWGQEVYDRLWMRMLVETAIQGFGVGFVGTEGSTMSLVAGRRTEDWQGGVSRMVSFSIWD